jgi:hypothetical protein
VLLSPCNRSSGRVCKDSPIRVALLAVCLVAAGCGGGDGLSRDEVESRTSETLRARLQPGEFMDDLKCVQDGADGRWRCLTYTRKGDKAYQVTLYVTCDRDRCLSEPAAFARVP